MPEKDGARITPPSVRGFPPENDEKGRFLRNRSFFARLFAVSAPFLTPVRFLPVCGFSEFFFTTGRPSVPVFPFPALTVPCVSFLLSPPFFLRCPSVSPLSLRPCVVLLFLRCPCPSRKRCFFLSAALCLFLLLADFFRFSFFLSLFCRIFCRFRATARRLPFIFCFTIDFSA